MKELREVEYSNEYLLERTKQLEYDYRRLYPDGNREVPLYESLEYHRYLCYQRGLNITNKKCFRCGSYLYPSDVDGYEYVCYECDENFYEFEAVD